MYYVLESATTAEGTAKAVTTKDNFRMAQMLYYQVLASMTANDKVNEGFCTIIDTNGRQMVEYTARYIKPRTQEPSTQEEVQD